VGIGPVPPKPPMPIEPACPLGPVDPPVPEVAAGFTPAHPAATVIAAANEVKETFRRKLKLSVLY
jgi:hypothetical protein